MKNKRLLIISAHADDNIACAGTVFKLKENFGFVPYEIVLTNSALGQNFKSAKELSESVNVNTRSKELIKASKFLGIEKSFQLNQEDLGLSYSKELVLKLVKVIRIVKPNIVFLHNSYDAHPDHKIAYKLGLDSIKISAMGVKKETYGKPFRVPLVLCCEGMLPIEAQILVDISKFLKKKTKLFKIYQSQASPKAIGFEEGLAKVRGYHLKKDRALFAEAFTLQNEFPILLFE